MEFVINSQGSGLLINVLNFRTYVDESVTKLASYQRNRRFGEAFGYFCEVLQDN